MRLLKALGKALLVTVGVMVLVLILGVALAGFQYLFGEAWGNVALIAISLFLSAFSAYFIAN